MIPYILLPFGKAFIKATTYKTKTGKIVHRKAYTDKRVVKKKSAKDSIRTPWTKNKTYQQVMKELKAKRARILEDLKEVEAHATAAHEAASSGDTHTAHGIHVDDAHHIHTKHENLIQELEDINHKIMLHENHHALLKEKNEETKQKRAAKRAKNKQTKQTESDSDKTEDEKHRNRSEAMLGNDNAKKDGLDEKSEFPTTDHEGNKLKGLALTHFQIYHALDILHNNEMDGDMTYGGTKDLTGFDRMLGEDVRRAIKDPDLWSSFAFTDRVYKQLFKYQNTQLRHLDLSTIRKPKKSDFPWEAEGFTSSEAEKEAKASLEEIAKQFPGVEAYGGEETNQPIGRTFVRSLDEGTQPYYKKDGIQIARESVNQRPTKTYLAEHLAAHLKDHQKDGVNQTLQNYENGHKATIIADGTGAGKTYQALALAQTQADSKKSVFIVTKDKGVIADAFKRDGDRLGVTFKHITHAKDIPDKPEPGVIYITAYNRLGEFKDHKFDQVIFDECHSLKNAASKQTKNGRDILFNAKNVLLLSATPMDKVDHLGYICAAYGIKRADLMWDLGYEKGGYNDKQWVARDYSPEEIDAAVAAEIEKASGDFEEAVGGDEAWARKIRQSMRQIPAHERAMRFGSFFEALTEMGLMMKREVSLDNMDYKPVYVDLPPEAQKTYDAEYNRMLNEVERAEPQERGQKKMNGLMRIRRMLEEHKVSATIDRMKKKLAEGKQVVIFAERVNESKVSDDYMSAGTLKSLSASLDEMNIPYSGLYGSAKKGDQKKIDDFQSGKTRVFICTPQRGSTGISLDDTKGDSPRAMVVMTAPFSANEVIQMFGRSNRLTTKSRTDVNMIFTETEVDHWNRDIITTKLATLGSAVEGDYKYINVEGVDQDDLDDAKGTVFVQEKRRFKSLEAYNEVKAKRDERAKQLAEGKIEEIKYKNDYLHFIPRDANGNFDFQKPWPNPTFGFGKPKEKGGMRGKRVSESHEFYFNTILDLGLSRSQLDSIRFDGISEEEHQAKKEHNTFIPVKVGFNSKDSFKDDFRGDYKWDGINKTWTVRKSRHDDFLKKEKMYKSMDGEGDAPIRVFI